MDLKEFAGGFESYESMVAHIIRNGINFCGESAEWEWSIPIGSQDIFCIFDTNPEKTPPSTVRLILRENPLAGYKISELQHIGRQLQDLLITPDMVWYTNFTSKKQVAETIKEDII